MMTRCVWLLSIMILLLGVMGCTSVSSPTPTPTTTSAPPTERPLPTPSATATPLLERTAVASPTPSPVSTSTVIAPPEPVATVQAETSPPDVVWSENVAHIVSINDIFTFSTPWSPVKNELVYRDCSPVSESRDLLDDFVFLATAPLFEGVGITPVGFSCLGISVFTWSPNGQEIFFGGTQDPRATEPYDSYATVDLWRLDKSGNATFTNLRGWYLNLHGWLGDEIVLYSIYSGGMARYLMLHDLRTDQQVATTWLYNPTVHAIGADFAIVEYGNPEFFNSVAIFSVEPVHNEQGELTDDLGSHSLSLSEDGTISFPSPNFSSSYSDWLPGKNQILVETWNKEINILESDLQHEKVMDLQLWDVAANTLEMVKEGAFLGDYSPDRSHLAYVSSNETGPRIQLTISDTQELLFSAPVYLAQPSYGSLLSFHAFSPNGRYFTFFTPETDLAIYDLETGEMLPSLTAVPALPIWSPDSARFVYTDPTLGLSIYDTRNNTTFPLAESGGERLSNPQWSFDGAYLSVVTKIGEVGEWEWQTAVLAPLDNTTGQLDNGTVTEPFWRQAMVTITVKNIPDDLYADLKRAAANNRRSINSEIIVSIEQAVRSTRTDPDELLEKIRVLREATARYTLTDEILDQTINEGRP